MALSELNLSNLRTNFGVYFAAGYFGLFFTLSLIIELATRRRRRLNFYLKLYLHSQKDDDLKIEDPISAIQDRVRQLEEDYETKLNIAPLRKPNKK